MTKRLSNSITAWPILAFIRDVLGNSCRHATVERLCDLGRSFCKIQRPPLARLSERVAWPDLIVIWTQKISLDWNWIVYVVIISDRVAPRYAWCIWSVNVWRKVLRYRMNRIIVCEPAAINESNVIYFINLSHGHGLALGCPGQCKLGVRILEDSIYQHRHNERVRVTCLLVYPGCGDCEIDTCRQRHTVHKSYGSCDCV